MGHCDVPQKYAKYPNLGGWVRKKGQKYRLLKSGKNSRIRDERIVKLEKLVIKWNYG